MLKRTVKISKELKDLKKAIQIDSRDNVATLTSNAAAGEEVNILSPEGTVIVRLVALEAIPSGHKVAMSDIERGERVLKYGETIGLASKRIKSGTWVHIQNVESAAVPTSAFRSEIS